MQKAQGLLAPALLALAYSAPTAQSADWIMLQGTEPADAGLYGIFGRVRATDRRAPVLDVLIAGS